MLISASHVYESSIRPLWLYDPKMESSSSTTLSIAQYSDSFNSPSSGTDDNGASEIISSRTNEDNYTSDSFNSLTTVSIDTRSHKSSHESDGGGAARARYYDHRGISHERSKLSYDEDIFESLSNEYSSNSSKDESSEESLESSIEKEHQLQKKFLKSLKKAKKNVAKASNAENDNNKLEPEAESNLLPEMHEYCHRKLHLLKNVNGKKLKSNDSLQCIKQDDHFQATLPITKRRLEEMKIENIRHRMKQRLDEVVEHNIKTCPVCMKAQEEITQKQFVGLKKTFLQSKLIEQRIQRHLEYKHSLDLIGELAASLPKPSDDPQQIWGRLLNR